MARRLVALLLLALLAVIVSASAAIAQEEAPQEETSQEEVPSDVAPPAVEIVDEAPEAAEDEWTFKYLVPATVLLAVVAILVTVIQYFTKVTRARQRVAE